MEDLERSAHPFEIPERNTITVNLDYKQMGVGGDNSWGAMTHSQYTLPSKEYSYSFRLRPFNLNSEELEKLSKMNFPK